MYASLSLLAFTLALGAAQNVTGNITLTGFSYSGIGCPDKSAYLSAFSLKSPTPSLSYQLSGDFTPYMPEPGTRPSDRTRRCDLNIGLQIGKEWRLRLLGTSLHNYFEIPENVNLRVQGVYSWAGKTDQGNFTSTIEGPFRGVVDKTMESVGRAESACGGGELALSARSSFYATGTVYGTIGEPEPPLTWYFNTGIEVVRCEEKGL